MTVPTFEDATFVDATTNAGQANALVAAALEEANKPTSAAPPEVKVAAQPDCEVALMAGIGNMLTNEFRTLAVVRELTGADEEVLTAPTVQNNPARFLATVVFRGTETIGGEKPTQRELDGLLIGDRELLLLGIRRATYGEEVELITRCPHCGDEDADFKYPLRSVPFRKLENQMEALLGFDVTTPSGKVVHCNLPTAGDQDVLLQAEKKNEGELNTMMLSKCVSTIDGQQVYGEGPVKALSIKDRKALLTEINEKSPGPRLGEAKRTCRACEKEFDLNLGLLDIFRV